MAFPNHDFSPIYRLLFPSTPSRRAGAWDKLSYTSYLELTSIYGIRGHVSSEREENLITSFC
uniref:Uncharacterized protein n=1 Tax=Anguilla anguilla TaxID=7936 RepID=A0A0E9WG69_ANGAN